MPIANGNNAINDKNAADPAEALHPGKTGHSDHIATGHSNSSSDNNSSRSSSNNNDDNALDPVVET